MAGHGKNVASPRPGAGTKDESKPKPFLNGTPPQQQRQAPKSGSTDSRLRTPTGSSHPGMDVQQRRISNGSNGMGAKNAGRTNGDRLQSAECKNRTTTRDGGEQQRLNNSSGNRSHSPAVGRGKRPSAWGAGDAQNESSPIQKKLKKDENKLKCRLLLPNGTCLSGEFGFTLAAGGFTTMNAVLNFAKIQSSKQDSVRKVQWDSKLRITNDRGFDISPDMQLRDLVAEKKSAHVRVLIHDGHKNTVHTDEGMWNVTPKPEMLGQLPQGYTLQTALADQVDNALQAIWHNDGGERRLISVRLSPDQIVIFDTGPGMDCRDEKSLSNWATVGSSTHRSEHHKAIGGEPPFLMPYLGKYGAGGPSAALHLGSKVIVRSKTKDSNLVWSLRLEQDALVEKQMEENTRMWRSRGECREMTERERELSPHGSFTKVVISRLKPWYCISNSKDKQYWTVDQIQELLKDVYFPYIQTETGVSSKTVCSVQFEVNDVNLLEVTNCETAIRKMHTCIGDPFVVDINMTRALEKDTPASSMSATETEANARITCNYYPTQKGKEALESVVEELKAIHPTVQRTYENLKRLSVRWLGRLLPEMNWDIFPFMELPAKKIQKLGLQPSWAKRVAAFLDTDAGFHPNQSKTELERDQPFVVALQRTGAPDFCGTSAYGVAVKLRHNGKELTPAELSDAFLEWLKDMHVKYDEEYTFLDDGIYIINCAQANEELGITNRFVIFHKHMKYGQGEYLVNEVSPLWIKLPKGTKGSNLKSDLHATVEYFFRDGADDDNGEVKFLCRPIDVPEEDGCSITADMRFERRKSLWFSAALLSSVKRLDANSWKKKTEEMSNKAPSHVEILNEDEAAKLEAGGSDQISPFPVDGRKVEAGFIMPTEVLAVVRPRRGSGPSHKQGMIVSDQMNLVLTVTRCNCVGHCGKLKAPLTSLRTSANFDLNHGEVVARLGSAPRANNSGLKGLYTFRIESSEIGRLRLQGKYIFHIFVADDEDTGITPAVSSLQVLSSKVTSRWTVCNHPEDCGLVDHDSVLLPLTIRLNEQLPERLYLQKYDEFGNPQPFEAPIQFKLRVVTPKGGDSFGMETKVIAKLGKLGPKQFRLQVKHLLFENGSLSKAETLSEGLLRVCCPDKQIAEMRCKVLPGRLASVKVSESSPSINSSTHHFSEPLQPYEVVKKLTLQGLDVSGNKIDRGQRMRIILEGLAFHDQNPEDREVDESGCLHLGGLMRVTSHYNSTGSLTVLVNSSKSLKINFKTVRRELIVKEVPPKCYVGQMVEGVSVQIVDENGNRDATLGGHNHSIALEWQTGVTYPLTEGKCIIPAFRLPATPGRWKGTIYFSANKSLAVKIEIELELAVATRLESVVLLETVKAKCGVLFVVPFLAQDDQNLPAILTERMQELITAEAESKGGGNKVMLRPCSVECRSVEKSKFPNPSRYEGHLVLSGAVGEYVITLKDSNCQLQGRAEVPCILEHGLVSRLSLTRVDDKPIQDLYKPVVAVEVTRRRAMPDLSVSLLDSDGNVCTSCKRSVLVMSIADCSEWEPLKAEVSKGTAQWRGLPVLIPVGTYHVSILLEYLDKTTSARASNIAITTEFPMVVRHGNYPSALKLEDITRLKVSHSDAEDEHVPQMTVFVESADGCKLQNRVPVALRVYGVRSIEHKDEYDGTFVETLETQLVPIRTGEMPQPAKQVAKYIFTGVNVPSKAGSYLMEFYVRGHDEVAVQSRYLHVIVGPPKKIDIRSERGQKVEKLSAWLVDAHGNTCDNAPNIEMQLDLKFEGHIVNDRECTVKSSKSAVTSQGHADFGLFQLSEGISGIYLLQLSLKDKMCGISADFRIFVTKGNISGDLSSQCSQLQDAEKKAEDFLKTYSNSEATKKVIKAQIRQVERDVRDLQDTLDNCTEEIQVIEHEREQFEDERTLSEELRQPVRSSSDVLMDIRSWAQRTNNNASAALLDAMSSPSTFLTSVPAGREVLGMVVLLARVEIDVLNTRLSTYLGTNSLLLICCRTQAGVNLLEQHDNGRINENAGLHGFAKNRGYRISGTYQSLALEDVRPYWRRDGGEPVDLRHPQRLLNIDPPLLPNRRIPDGFLGYAVNLIHINNENMLDGVGLRESLFYHLFNHLQVYDTRRNMIAAKEKLKYDFTGAVSLDGGLIRKNKHQEMGRRSENVPIRFGSVEYGERQTVSIVPPYCFAFRREDSLTKAKTKLTDISNQLHDRQAAEGEKNKQIQMLERNLRVLKDQRRKSSEKVHSIRKELDVLSKAASVVETRASLANPARNILEVQAFHL